MAFNRFRFFIILRVLLLSANIILIALSFNNASFVMLNILLVGTAIYQISSLIRYAESVNRDLKRFFDSIQYSDFSQSFSSANLGPTFVELKKSFTKVTSEFLKIRSEKEERFRYFETVVEHIPTGLISFRADGEVEFINRAALKLLGLNNLRNINHLERVDKSLTETFLKISSGGRTLYKRSDGGKAVHLALSAIQFKIRGVLFTLATIQNIQSEVERERLARELEIGQEVQYHLLPEIPMQLDGYDIAAFCKPAKEVGGDYYDFIPVNEHTMGLIIGDVSGKGLPAAIYMTLTKGIMQSCVYDGITPAHSLIKANRLIYRTIGKGFFVSLLVALLDTKRNLLTIARAGHNPLLHFKKQSVDVDVHTPGGIALGLENGEIFADKIENKEIQLKPGDVAVLYTDGFSEAMNASQHEFGEAELAELLKKNHEKDAKSLLATLSAVIEKHMADEPRHDDMTMIVVKSNMDKSKVTAEVEY